VDDALIDESLATAEVAAEHAGVTLDEVHGHTTARAVSELLDTVWGRSTAAGAVLAREALTAMTHAGCQVTTAWRDGDLVGATAALLGRDHDTGEVFLHSHVTGVHPSAQGSGIGRALKWHQRAWCLTRGIAEVRWTYDPLIRRNAVLNLVLLGAHAASYERDVYGPMDDARNAGLPTDRVVAVWTLDAPRTCAAAAGRAAAPDVDALLRAGAEPLLQVGDDDNPVLTPTDAARRLVQIPADVEAIRARDRDLAGAWADAVRASLGEAMRGGSRVSGVTRDGWYVLAPPAGVTELAEVR
jgi:predicted GNAT superfamily acetyltransferase